GEVADHLVHPVDAEGGEVVAEVAQVPPGVGVQTAVDQLVDRLPAPFQGLAPELQEPVELTDQGRLVTGIEVAEPGHVHGDHADGAGQLRGAEQAVAALEQLAQVQLEAAAHGADHARVQIGVDEVL